MRNTELKILVVAVNEKQARAYRMLQSDTARIFVATQNCMEKTFGLEVHEVLIAPGVSENARQMALTRKRLT